MPRGRPSRLRAEIAYAMEAPPALLPILPALLALLTIRCRATNLAGNRPELAEDLEAYVCRQEREVALMAGSVMPAIWVLRRRADG